MKSGRTLPTRVKSLSSPHHLEGLDSDNKKLPWPDIRQRVSNIILSYNYKLVLTLIFGGCYFPDEVVTFMIKMSLTSGDSVTASKSHL